MARGLASWRVMRPRARDGRWGRTRRAGVGLAPTGAGGPGPHGASILPVPPRSHNPETPGRLTPTGPDRSIAVAHGRRMADLVRVVEDEKEIRDLLRYNLERAGFRVAA